MARLERFSRPRSTGERGYVLLALLLMAALLLVTAAAVAPRIAQQVQRDREEELIHRGMQYRRAIRAFAKSTGRFPLRLDELENTNGVRFLRKQYKDPITGADFRLLHPGDITASGAGLNAAPAQDQNAARASVEDVATSGTLPATADDAAAQNAAQPSSTSPKAAPAGSSASVVASNSMPLRGGLILGVASSSKKRTIREFEHKSRYDQWLFFYSAVYDGSLDPKGPTPTRPIFPAAKATPDASEQTGQPSP